MNKFDVALKLVLQNHADVALRQIAGAPIVKWHNIELPQTQLTSMDLLGETAGGVLVHIELQSTNDPQIPLRMAEYYLRLYRRLRRFPIQVVLYVGKPPLTMSPVLNTPALIHTYKVIDVRDLDGQKLLDSSGIGDNMIAVLTKLADTPEAIHRILERFASLEPQERQ